MTYNFVSKKLARITIRPGEFLSERLSSISRAEAIFGSHSLKGDREVQVDVTQWLLSSGKELH
jgi:hypothetical protein